MIGQRVGVYEIRSQIGEGGMGKVFRGIDSMVHRDVAIKALHTSLLTDQGLVDRFRSEAMTMAKLQHPSICQLYSLVPEGGQFFMIMEFVEGDTIENFLKAQGPLEFTRAMAIFAQILEAFSYAHSKGVIHRDIKPANVMLGADDRVKIMDFGIARVLGSSRMTMTGRLVGTPAYMSPEQVTGADVDARSDIYSLGIVLYQMLTGQVPFRKTSDFAILRAHVDEQPPSPRQIAQHVSPDAERVLLKSLAKNPNERYQTAAEFLEAVVECVPSAAGHLATGAHRNMRTPRTGGPTAPDLSALHSGIAPPAAKGSHIGVIVGILLALLIAGGWGVYQYRVEKAAADARHQEELRDAAAKLEREKQAEQKLREERDAALKDAAERQRRKDTDDRRAKDAEKEKERIRDILR